MAENLELRIARLQEMSRRARIARRGGNVPGTAAARPGWPGTGGPGTELHAMLAQLGFEKCDVCQRWIGRMDQWGPAGCRTHREQILAHLRKQEAKAGRLAKLRAGSLAFWNGLPLSVEGLVDEAIRRAEAKRPTITINQGAGGLGDAISASSAVNGLRLLHEGAGTGARFVYKVPPHAIPFLELLDLGAVEFAHHDWDKGSKSELPPNAPPTDVQINPGYQQELASRGTFTRLERNCRNLGGVAPKLAALRDPGRLTAAGRDMLGAVVLAPFSTWTNREWPLANWLQLERLLREQGYRVLVADGTYHAKDKGRARQLRSEKLIDAPAERIAGVLLNAALLISNDSGLAHVAGILGAPGLVLCNMLPGHTMYGFYGPHLHFIDNPNLHAVAVDQVLGRAVELAGAPRWPAERSGETAKAHARRLREGWYAEHVKAPCIDVGCWVDYLLPGFPCRRWDQMYGDGDASYMHGVPDAAYATVYASHVLEHVHDPVLALRSWWRILKRGGKLIVCVPHRELYEGKKDLPSRWNPDHKTFWVPGAPAADDPPHTRGLRQVLAQAVPDAELLSLRVLDEGHHYPDPRVHPRGEFSIEAILRKR